MTQVMNRVTPERPVPTRYRCDCGAIAAVEHPCGGCGGQRVFGYTADEIAALRALFAEDPSRPTQRGVWRPRTPELRPQENLRATLAYEDLLGSFQ